MNAWSMALFSFKPMVTPSTYHLQEAGKGQAQNKNIDITRGRTWRNVSQDA